MKKNINSGVSKTSVIKNLNANYFGNLKTFTLSNQSSNTSKSGYYVLISDVTNLYKDLTWAAYGIEGIFICYRDGNLGNCMTFRISCRLGSSQTHRLNVDTTDACLTPYVVKYEDNYYLALKNNYDSQTGQKIFLGWTNNLLPTFKYLYISEGLPESFQIVFSPSRYPDYNGNSLTTTSLVSSRRLWGQNFNGTADIDGSMVVNGDIVVNGKISATGGVNTVSLQEFNSLKKEVEILKSQQNNSETNEMKTQDLSWGGGQLTYSLPISYNYLNTIKRKEWLQHEA